MTSLRKVRRFPSQAEVLRSLGLAAATPVRRLTTAQSSRRAAHCISVTPCPTCPTGVLLYRYPHISDRPARRQSGARNQRKRCPRYIPSILPSYSASGISLANASSRCSFERR